MSEARALLTALSGGDSWTGSGVAARRIRDLVIVDLGERSLVIACDSNASIGSKPADHLQQDPEITGYSAAKVPVMEVLASGATPFLLVDNLCCDLETTGLALVAGIRRLLDETGLAVMMTGSDEANMPTVQTGVGITVLGIAGPGALRVGGTRAGDRICVVGMRRSGLAGDEYVEGGAGIATARHIRQALALDGVHEVLPVGSSGIAHECRELARVAGLEARLRDAVETDLDASAGSSTCFLAAVDDRGLRGLESLGLPIEIVADANGMS
jgi:hypothetical protein